MLVLALIALQQYSPLPRRFYPSENRLNSRCLTLVIVWELVHYIFLYSVTCLSSIYHCNVFDGLHLQSFAHFLSLLLFFTALLFLLLLFLFVSSFWVAFSFRDIDIQDFFPPILPLPKLANGRLGRPPSQHLSLINSSFFFCLFRILSLSFHLIKPSFSADSRSQAAAAAAAAAAI